MNRNVCYFRIEISELGEADKSSLHQMGELIYEAGADNVAFGHCTSTVDEFFVFWNAVDIMKLKTILQYSDWKYSFADCTSSVLMRQEKSSVFVSTFEESGNAAILNRFRTEMLSADMVLDILSEIGFENLDETEKKVLFNSSEI